MKTRSVYEKMTESEREVARYLEKKGLLWEFEFPVFVYEENNRPRLWTPDFYIPKLGLFVEVCGSEKYDYEYRRKVYNKNKIPVAFLNYYKNPTKWISHFKKRVAKIQRIREIELQKLE